MSDLIVYRKNGYTDNNFHLVYESEVYNGEKLDTRVLLENDLVSIPLFMIAGADIEKFNQELTDLITKYRI